MKKIKSITISIISVVGIIASIIFGINQWKSSSNPLSKNEVLEIINSYYHSVLNQDYQKMESFYALKIDRFFEKKNIDFKDIKKRISKYNDTWKHQDISIRENTLIVTSREDEFTHLRYEIDYNIKKEKSDSFREYDLKISVILNSDNKIVSIYEEKK